VPEVSVQPPSAAAAPVGQEAIPPKRSTPPFQIFPTLRTAGAKACKILPPIVLGARDNGYTIVGFGPQGGVATWMSGASTLALQRLARDGTKVGAAASAQVGKGLEPKHVYPVDRGFVVLLLRWDSQNGVVAWEGMLYDSGGRAHEPVDIGLDGMVVRVGQPLDGHAVGLIVSAAYIAKQKQPGRWQTVTVGADGKLISVATAIAVDDLVTTTDDAFVPATLAGKRGWMVLRNDARRPDGVFGGTRVAAAHAAPLSPSDGLIGVMRNRARPPPRGRGGTIREALGRPTLVRMHKGKELGDRLALEWHGNPVGAVAMNIESLLFWSGTHFVYPFRGNAGACLLPIDCRP